MSDYCCKCEHYIEWMRDDVTSSMSSCRRIKNKIFPVQPMEEACEYFEVKKNQRL